MLMRKCTRCKTEKPFAQFWADRSKRHGLSSKCKSCQVELAREYRKAHPELAKARYWNNRDFERERHLKRKYGINFSDYKALLADQSGGCAICKLPEPKHKMLDVDHDHLTGAVRGLLCTSCNRMLGHAKDNLETLSAAIIYLGRNSQRNSSKRSKKV